MAGWNRTLVLATLALALASPAGAATLALTSGTLTVALGGLPPITIPANSGVAVSVSGTTGAFTLPASAFGPATVSLPATLFTGIPSLSGFSASALANPLLDVTGGAATGGMKGTAFVNVLQFAAIPLAIRLAGAPLSMTAMAHGGAILITYHSQGAWTTGAAVVTGIITTTPGTAVINTVSIAGSDSRSGDHAGSLTLVTGFRVATTIGFTWPGFVSMRTHWAVVPEPGTGLLLGAGTVVLALFGRRRLRS